MRTIKPTLKGRPFIMRPLLGIWLFALEEERASFREARLSGRIVVWA
jgi:hypothetical protein